mgnify:CR=1 FL=1
MDPEIYTSSKFGHVYTIDLTEAEPLEGVASSDTNHDTYTMYKQIKPRKSIEPKNHCFKTIPITFQLSYWIFQISKQIETNKLWAFSIEKHSLDPADLPF